MAMPMYNKVRADGSNRSIVMYPGRGLNQAQPPASIQDGQIMVGVNWSSPDGLSIRGIPALQTTMPYLLSANTGVYNYEAAIVGFTGSDSAIPTLVAAWTPVPEDTWRAWRWYWSDGTLDTSIQTEVFAFDVNNRTYGSFEYITQAETYGVYWSQLENRFILLKVSDGSFTVQALPDDVYPVCMVAHRTRIFLIDTNNTLWWCDAGDPTTWYGGAVDEEYKADDAGYWFIDAGDDIHNMISFNGELFLFGNNCIYVFMGYSTDTFALEKRESGIGTYAYSSRCVATGEGTMYFTHNDKVYEYHGVDSPQIISEPVIVGNSAVNGISGGIDIKYWQEHAGEDINYSTPNDNPDWTFRSLVFSKGKLYLWPLKNEITYAGKYYLAMYVFDAKHRTWWFQDGVTYDPSFTGDSNPKRLTAIAANDSKGNVMFAASVHGIVPAEYHAPKSAIYIVPPGCFEQTNTTYMGRSYRSFFVTGPVSTLLDGRLVLDEVDIVWRYVGDREISYNNYMTMYARFIPYPIERKARQGTFEENMTYNNWAGHLGYAKPENPDYDALWTPYMENTYFNTDPDDDYSWQKTYHVTKYKNSGRNYLYSYPAFGTPPMQVFELAVWYAPIQIDRIEFRYRAIGASR